MSKKPIIVLIYHRHKLLDLIHISDSFSEISFIILTSYFSPPPPQVTHLFEFRNESLIIMSFFRMHSHEFPFMYLGSESFIVISSHLCLCLPGYLLPLITETKILYASHSSHARYVPHSALPPSFEHLNTIIW
jgi:hypothetical protein